MTALRSSQSIPFNRLRNCAPRGSAVLLKEACSAWVDDEASTYGAALAFYAILSLAPVAIVTIALASMAFGRKAAEGELILQIRAVGGHNVATVIQTVIQGIKWPKLGPIATFIGIGTVLIGASGAFVELQTALNRIWKVKPRSERFWVMEMRKRWLSFGLVLVTGFLLLVSLAMSAMLGIVGKFLGQLLPTSVFFAQSIHFFLSFGITTFLFALIFKVLPDAEIDWSDVWIGAAVTSLLFTVGKVLIGLYLSRSSLASVYGTAGSLVVALVWVYYSMQILLLGAEFTHIYAERNGSRAKEISGSWVT